MIVRLLAIAGTLAAMSLVDTSSRPEPLIAPPSHRVEVRFTQANGHVSTMWFDQAVRIDVGPRGTP